MYDGEDTDMRISVQQLRQLIREELELHIFETTDLEEQDQDGDGDKDFDDVRVARYVKGGMSRGEALSKVKRKPMGK